jgi:surface antigen
MKWTAIASALLITGCNTLDVQDSITGAYAVVGAAAGGALGYQLAGSDQRAEGTALGTFFGGLVGYGLARYLEEQDRRRLAEATQETLSTGRPQTWSNPDTGVAGRTEVIKTPKKTRAVAASAPKASVATASRTRDASVASSHPMQHTAATGECRTIQQTVILADRTTKSETVTACLGPNGWEQS